MAQTATSPPALANAPSAIDSQKPSDAETTSTRLRGLDLGEALRRLEDLGLRIVFTTELVRDEMTVDREPRGPSARDRLDEILAQHGLAAKESTDGILVVVRAGPAIEAAQIIGSVRSRGKDRERIEASVRLLETGQRLALDDRGTFRFHGLGPGRYTVEVSAPGHLDERATNVSLGSGETRALAFSLTPLPFLNDEIVVRPSHSSLLDERPEHSEVSLGNDELERLPHLGGDVFRTTSLLPGVATDDVSAKFSVHGGRSDEVKIVLDGQELYDAYHLKDYSSALSVVPASVLANADLTTGAYAADQGDRMSGVLDLRTADPPAGRRTMLGIGLLEGRASASNRFANEQGSWMAIGRRGSLDLARKAIGNEYPAFWDVLAKAELATDFGHLSARGLVANDDLLIDRNDDGEIERLDNRYQTSHGWLTHRAPVGDRALVETIGSWVSIEHDRSGMATADEGEYALGDRRRHDVFSISHRWDLDLEGEHKPSMGFESRHYDARFNYFRSVESNIEIDAPFASDRPDVHRFQGRLDGTDLALWVTDRFTGFDRLTAEVGLRYDHHSATRQNLISPRLNLAWLVGERTVIRGAWGRFYQSQRPYELEVADGEERLQSAERSDHWVIGFETRMQDNRWGIDSLRIEAYDRSITNPRPRFESLLEPLNFFPEIEPDRVRIAADHSRSQGVELTLKGRHGQYIDWWLAYSLSRAEDRLDDRWVPRAKDQPQALAIDVNFRLPRSWNLNFAWRWHTGWPTTPVSGQLIFDPEEPDEDPAIEATFGRLRSERLQDYHRLDLRASRRWLLRSGTLTFYVDLQNVYDRENLAGFDLTINEEAGTVGLRDESWPGIFPSLGISWEF